MPRGRKEIKVDVGAQVDDLGITLDEDGNAILTPEELKALLTFKVRQEKQVKAQKKAQTKTALRNIWKKLLGFKEANGEWPLAFSNSGKAVRIDPVLNDDDEETGDYTVKMYTAECVEHSSRLVSELEAMFTVDDDDDDEDSDE